MKIAGIFKFNILTIAIEPTQPYRLSLLHLSYRI